ncbi:MAG TPA: hypothetical protein VHB50_09900 [Bryobacteraceae bacterium]|nr:hypothetical protein [Bryobacteraceae bacterium]
MSMISVITDSISDGLVPAERIARIEDADGSVEEIAVSVKDINENRLVASEIGRRGGKVLVELPRESASGRWRIWVKETAVRA